MSPDLYAGVTMAGFKALGKVLSLIDLFIILAKGEIRDFFLNRNAVCVLCVTVCQG